MTDIFDYNEPVELRGTFRNNAGQLAVQTGAVITITDPSGTVMVSSVAMTEFATGVYDYTYIVPATGPDGTWTFTAIGTNSLGHENISSGVFFVAEVDVPHTTPDTVRDMLPDLLQVDIDMGITTGSTIVLSSSVLEVSAILKNNVLLYDSKDYTFIRPKTVTLIVAGTGENFIVSAHLVYTDVQLLKFIARSDRIINTIFQDKTTPTAGYLDDWSASLTVYQILKFNAKGDEDKLAWAKSYEDDAMQSIDEYKTNISRTACNDTGVSRADALVANEFKLDQSSLKKYV